MDNEINFTREEADKIFEMYKLVKEQRKERFVTINEFYSDYLNWIRKSLSDSYYKSHKVSSRHLCKHLGKDTLLREISKKDVDELLLKLREHAPKGVNVFLRNYKAAFNKAIDWEFIEQNPFEKTSKVKHQKTEEVTINRDEMYEIWQKMNNDVIRDIMVVSYFTGMRLSEVVNLTWNDVDIEKSVITVGSENLKTKTKEFRKIPFGVEVHFAITNYIKNRKRTNYIFTKDNMFNYTTGHVTKTFKKGVKAWGKNNDVHFHSLRHSFATNVLMITGNIFVVQKLLGHTQISTTQRYSHFDYESVRSSLKAI